MLPKYLHQLAPANRDDWHPIWHHCRESWLGNFKSVNFVLWDDDEIDQLVKTKYPYYYNLFISFPFQINRVDFARFCIMHQYGGVYADMDMFCYENFFNNLTDKCYIVGSSLYKEVVQNSLMAAVPGQEFFEECMDACKFASDSGNFVYDKSNITTRESNDYVLNVTGPRLLSRVFESTKTNVTVLPAEEYNPGYLTYNSNIKTKHMLTGRWGREMIDIKKSEYESNKDKMTHQDYLKVDYKGFRKIDVDSFNFKKDYLIS